MQCHKCNAGSKLIRGGARRLRECENGHRWFTTLLEIRDTKESPPARKETVEQLRSEGKTMREIADALCMSTRTVQEMLKPISLSQVWR